MGLSYDEFEALFADVKREALHLNMRDSYGTDVELPHLAQWKAGVRDDFAWLQPWCDLVRQHVSAGRRFRRVDIASEPLSEYQQWLLNVQQPMVAAGQEIRRVSRRVTSELCFPGNDFWLLDDELVVFLHYSGDGLVADRVTATGAAAIQLCRKSFEAVWSLGVPLNDYHPVT